MKLVRIDELFKVEYGVNIDLNKLEEVTDNELGINYVGRSEKFNGVTARVRKTDIEPNPGYTISVAGGGSVLSTFVQESEYYSGRDLFVLHPKFKPNLNELLYYAMCIRKHKFKFSYGRQANKTLGELLIPALEMIPKDVLTFKNDTLKDFDVVEEYGEQISSSMNKINFSKLVPLDEIFEIYNGLSSSKVVVQDDRSQSNLIPYVRPSKWQATSYAGYLDPENVPEDKIYEEETLYVSTDGAGSHTYSYVSVEKFVPNSNVCVLIPKKSMSVAEKFIYATFITHNRFKFSYGRKPKKTKLSKILVPSISS